MEVPDTRVRNFRGRFSKKKIKDPETKGNINRNVILDHNYCPGTVSQSSYAEFNDALPRNVNRESWKEGRRVIELDILLSNLKYCKFCRLGPIPLTYYNIIGEQKKGLGGYLYVLCQNPDCEKINRAAYGKTHRTNRGGISHKRSGMPSFAVNTKLGTASWSAVREVFPGIQITGCVFHWSQAVFRQVKSLGLGPAYMARKSIWDYIRKLLVLPFLPYNHIENVFQQLAARASTEPLRKLIAYIDSQWIQSATFPIESWCVFKHRVRTNNDIEGWHTRLNGDCGNRGLSFYKLVPALRKQAQDVELDIEQLVDHGIGRRQRKVYRAMDKKIWSTWDDYTEQKIKSSTLLKIISQVYGASEYE